MITRALIRTEIDKVPEKYLEALYIVIKAFGASEQSADTDSRKGLDWKKFIAETYGCFADDPIVRSDQGVYE